MVDTTEAMESKYLTVQAVKESNNKKVVILNGGDYEETDYGRKLTVTAELDGREKIWRPNKDSVTNLSEAWGRESDAWVDGVAKLSVVKMQGKESLLAVPFADPVRGKATQKSLGKSEE